MSVREKNWTVYIIQARNGYFYTGITTDLKRRFLEHKHDPKKGAKFFRRSKPRKIVYREIHPTRSKALKGEAFIKSLTRREKTLLIKSM